MKKALLYMMVLLLMATGAACTTSAPATIIATVLTQSPAPALATPTAGTSNGKLEMLDIAAPSLKNNLIGEKLTQGIAVYTPPGYENSGKRYPVVYFLPGFDDDYQTYGMMFRSMMEKSLQSTELRAMIVVSINGCNRLHGSFYTNSPVTGNWEDFVVKDVVGYVDANFRTVRKPEARGIAGHSMGGYGTLAIAMAHPDVFCAAYSMSPGLFDMEGFTKSPIILAELYTLQVDSTDAYLESLKTAGADFTLAYGSAFAPNPAGPAPFIKTPAKDAKGALVHDDAWKMWEDGFGNLAERVKENRNNLKKLKALAIDCGKSDEYDWIPQGCVYFSGLLKAEGIDHTLTVYEGTHMSKVAERLGTVVLPFFSKELEGE